MQINLSLTEFKDLCYRATVYLTVPFLIYRISYYCSKRESLTYIFILISHGGCPTHDT